MRDRKYIRDNKQRQKDFLQWFSVGITLGILISILGYINNTNNEIERLEKEIEAQHIKYEIEDQVRKERLAEINRALDEKAYTIRIELENEYKESQSQLEQNLVVQQVTKEETKKTDDNIRKIRCTGYCDTGYTASGEWTRDGIAAGKREWMHKKIRLFAINDDDSVGDIIGTYEFKDTGAGIDTDGDGKGDSIKKGMSIDIWHATESACYDFSAQYGDYVYMEFIN